MVRTQIQLTAEQSKRLKKVAARRGISVAEVIRRSIDTTLATDDLPDMEKIRSNARSIFGKYQDKATDVSSNHDKYLSEAFPS
jgi:hypothetical protein